MYAPYMNIVTSTISKYCGIYTIQNSNINKQSLEEQIQCIHTYFFFCTYYFSTENLFISVKNLQRNYKSNGMEDLIVR